MDNQAPADLDLRRYLEILRRRKWAIILVTIVVTALAVGISLLQEPVYEGRTRVLLQPTAPGELPGLASGGNVTQEAVATELEVMGSEAVEVVVQQQLGRVPDVSFETVEGTSVVVIAAAAGNAQQAADDANGYATGYIDARRQLVTAELEEAAERSRQQSQDLQAQLALVEAPIRELEDQIAALPPEPPDEPTSPQRQDLLDARTQIETEISEERTALEARILTTQQELDQVDSSLSAAGTGSVEVLAPASTPGSPVSPQPLRNGVLALAVGLVLGITSALVREVLDDRIRRKEDLAAATGGRSVLGVIPAVSGWRDRKDARVISMTSPMSPAAEAYRTLRTSLQFVGLDESHELIQVTSPNSGEGKTTTVANLGVALAGAGQRVIVVCCDLRRPRIHHFYGVDNSIGFTSVLLGDSDLVSAIQDVPGEVRLKILPSGPIPPNPAEMLSTRRAQDLFQELTALADVILVDAPPVLPVTDALLVSGLVDATLMVAKVGSTNKRSARRAVELLEQVDANLVGTVVNGVAQTGEYGYGYGYGGYSSHRSSSGKGDAPRESAHDAPAVAVESVD